MFFSPDEIFNLPICFARRGIMHFCLFFHGAKAPINLTINILRLKKKFSMIGPKIKLLFIFNILTLIPGAGIERRNESFETRASKLEKISTLLFFNFDALVSALAPRPKYLVQF